MYLAFYNKEHVGDVLLLLKKETDQAIETEKKGDIVRVFIKETNETVAYNLFHASRYITLQQTGAIQLTEEQISQINAYLQQHAYEAITTNNAPKFVIGHVDSCQNHPDSDHLHITSVSVGEDKPLQIVCGAPNVKEGQLVVVAKVGAVMPSGLIIWPGVLRGVESHGMLCSARELNLPNVPQEKGILVLEAGQIGEEYVFSY